MLGWLGLAGSALSMYSTYEANKAADKAAEDRNKANALAAARSRKRAQEDAKKRKEELLRRFNIKSDKTQDTSEVIDKTLATKLTNFELQMASAQSVTDNVLATKHITGRLASRIRTTQDVQGSMSKGTMVQEAEAQHKALGDTLEMMKMDYEAGNLNIEIDLSNAINRADNQEVSGYTYSQSTGTIGVINSGVSGATSALSAGSSLGIK